MEQPFSSFMDEPALYRIQVYGCLSEGWISSYWGLTGKVVQHENGMTTTDMIGEVIDQAALVGLINNLYDLGHTIISVERQSADQMNEINKE
jgi:hypothetical protein